jgi:hypothetical protein
MPPWLTENRAKNLLTSLCGIMIWGESGDHPSSGGASQPQCNIIAAIAISPI